MRIAIFLFEFPKLSETFVVNQIGGLIDAGHEVDIFPYNRGDTDGVHEMVDRWGILARTHYPPPMPRRWIPRVAKAFALFVRYAHRAPIVILRSLNVPRYGRRSASLLLFFQVVPLIRRAGEYDVIHCHFGARGNEVVRFREIGAIRGPLVISLYGCDMSTFPPGTNPYGRLFHEGRVFLPISDHFRKLAISMGCPPERIEVNHVGVDVERFASTNRYRSPGEPLRLVSVGRLTEKKGLDDAIRAVATAHRQGCDCSYEIVGEGPARPELLRLIEACDAADYIRLVGPRTQAEVEELLRGTDAFLLPSRMAANGDLEGIPFSLMEACASGLPVLSTRHAGIPELVEDAVSGFLVEEGDVNLLAQRIITLASDPDLCVRMGEAGRRVVERSFNLSTQTSWLEALLTRVAGEAASRELRVAA